MIRAETMHPGCPFLPEPGTRPSRNQQNRKSQTQRNQDKGKHRKTDQAERTRKNKHPHHNQARKTRRPEKDPETNKPENPTSPNDNHARLAPTPLGDAENGVIRRSCDVFRWVFARYRDKPYGNPRGMGMDDSEKPPVCEACGRPVTERSKVNGAWLKSHRGCKDRIRTIRRRRAAEENEERLEAMFLEALEDRKRAANQWRWQIENRNELADEHDRVLAATLLVSYRCMIAAMNVMPSALIQYREPWAVGFWLRSNDSLFPDHRGPIVRRLMGPSDIGDLCGTMARHGPYRLVRPWSRPMAQPNHGPLWAFGMGPISDEPLRSARVPSSCRCRTRKCGRIPASPRGPVSGSPMEARISPSAWPLCSRHFAISSEPCETLGKSFPPLR